KSATSPRRSPFATFRRTRSSPSSVLRTSTTPSCTWYASRSEASPCRKMTSPVLNVLESIGEAHRRLSRERPDGKRLSKGVLPFRRRLTGRSREPGRAAEAMLRLPGDEWRLFLGDTPDHAGARDLHERCIGRIKELRRGLGLTEVTHGPIVHQVQRLIRAEHGGDGAVDPSESGDEGLLAFPDTGRRAAGDTDLVGLRAIEGKPREREGKGFTGLAEIDDLD